MKISYKQADRKEMMVRNNELIKNSLGLNILMFGFDSYLRLCGGLTLQKVTNISLKP